MAEIIGAQALGIEIWELVKGDKDSLEGGGVAWLVKYSHKDLHFVPSVPIQGWFSVTSALRDPWSLQASETVPECPSFSERFFLGKIKNG